jgi:tyrosyl-tRNA synthetase
MTLSEELKWRGLLEQTTYKDITDIDHDPISFYIGVDPSSDSITIGNLAVLILAKHFIQAGHKAYILIGGATGSIGDPDGKTEERQLLSLKTIEENKKAIIQQYRQIFEDLPYTIVDNYDWFKDIKFLDFLRNVGKHVPMRQMVNREFVQTRLNGNGISFAEFSYSLIQGYDFLTLFTEKGVSLQIAGSDQWGNALAGVDLIRRITGKSANVWTMPLIIDKSSGKKFGKTEAGAVWLNPKKTSPTSFYQFWINTSDESVIDFLKIYTSFTKEDILEIENKHNAKPKNRLAQKALAINVTKLVHGQKLANLAESVTGYLIGDQDISLASDEELSTIRSEIKSYKIEQDMDLEMILVACSLAKSKSEARKLISNQGIYVNNQKYTDSNLNRQLFKNGRLLIRRGKAFKDSALLEI